MKLFLAYLRQRRKGILVFFLFCAVFGVSFLLYQLPLASVAYPALLCVLLGCGFLCQDFVRVKRKHSHLLALQKQKAAMINSLPEIGTVEEADYQAIIRALQNEVWEVDAAASARYQDMVEYYTVWAHQIKTPITSMGLFLEREDTALSRKLTSDLFQIEQYVEMVMAFLRLGPDASDYLFREYPLDGIIRQAIAKFAPEFIARKLRLEYTPTEETVITDEKWLSLVIGQVLSNALKYTREGTIRIYMEPPKTLCVADTGIGIAPDELPRVFEKGYTGGNGRKDKRATGIGLYLCRRICQKLGAEISIASQPDRGTTVRINLEQYRLGKE